jgi:hypothetical protein
MLARQRPVHARAMRGVQPMPIRTARLLVGTDEHPAWGRRMVGWLRGRHRGMSSGAGWFALCSIVYRCRNARSRAVLSLVTRAKSAWQIVQVPSAETSECSHSIGQGGSRVCVWGGPRIRSRCAHWVNSKHHRCRDATVLIPRPRRPSSAARRRAVRSVRRARCHPARSVCERGRPCSRQQRPQATTRRAVRPPRW